MKKNIFVLLILLLFMPVGVLAAGGITATPVALEIEVGSSKTFTLSAYNTIGDVTISTSDASIATINTTQWGTGMVDEKQTKSTNITVTGKKVGNATITILIDAATFDEEDLSGQKKTVQVRVVEKKVVTKSNNNNLKSISIDGYQLVKKDANNYTLTVESNVKSINLKATAEDSKAKVTGTGTKTLKDGDNNFQVIITSESGLQNKINVKVTRKAAQTPVNPPVNPPVTPSEDPPEVEDSEKDDNTYLKELKIKGYSLKFSKNTTDYLLLINDEQSLNISVVPESDLSEVTIVGNEQLEDGSVIKIIVTAESGSQREYNIKIAKELNVDIDTGIFDNNKTDNIIDNKMLLYAGAGIFAVGLIFVVALSSKKKKK